MSTEPTVPTFIIQSDGLFREGLRLMLSRTRFRPQSCGIELDDLAPIPDDGPSLFIVGIEQKRDSICKRIRTEYPRSFIIAVGDETNRSNLWSALDDGANAALFSSVSPHALVSALHTVINGQLLVIDARLWSLEIQPKIEEQLSLKALETIGEQLPPSLQEESPPIQNIPLGAAENELNTSEQLSTREIAILERIVQGDSNKHVARFFGIAEPTVKAHVKAILRKVGATNRTQAAIWALNHRLFESVNDAPHELSVEPRHAVSRDDLLQNRPSAASKANGNGILKN
jgi:two-component system, NarL family, nitrate/nitrite response regulator NarL